MAAEEIKLKCQFCSQVFHSTYRLIPHVFMAHHKKVAKKIARNKDFVFTCQSGCDFVVEASKYFKEG